ncbi:hypothetical protein F3Y22_tig00112383pilonHSYRG00270 [Hibiscus syriacus]|uniref:Uncharacterized protein n=1 Tax=Hibiscus syriacus TaxID=106335 RepID=A0A6A2Y533_HIBSY|nr:hypothetical protein F3Y22_tig00112383pilonHSYRG00270 [Hibiscus syriacus]
MSNISSPKRDGNQPRNEAEALFETRRRLGVVFNASVEVVVKWFQELEEAGRGRPEKVRAVKGLSPQASPYTWIRGGSCVTACRSFGAQSYNAEGRDMTMEPAFSSYSPHWVDEQEFVDVVTRTVEDHESWLKWFKEGDKNTKFFRAIASMRNRRNEISQIRMSNQIASDPKTITSIIEGHFKEIYNVVLIISVKHFEVDMRRMGIESANALEVPFSVEELMEANDKRKIQLCEEETNSNLQQGDDKAIDFRDDIWASNALLKSRIPKYMVKLQRKKLRCLNSKVKLTENVYGVFSLEDNCLSERVRKGVVDGVFKPFMIGKRWRINERCSC